MGINYVYVMLKLVQQEGGYAAPATTILGIYRTEEAANELLAKKRKSKSHIRYEIQKTELIGD